MATDRARHDVNLNPTLVAVSSVDGETPVSLWADPVTHALPISASISGADGAIVDGSNATIRATVLSLTNSKPLTVAITDTSGNQISSFGGGTQYTDGGTPPANPVGGTIEWNEGGTWRTVSTAKPLPVTLSNASVAVTGTFFQATQPISASTLPLPTGAATSANQTTELSSLATIATNTTQIPSVPSTNNSSTATLLSGAVFTGTGDDCINYSEMRVTVFANVASATDGLSLQQSEDNTNWDVTDTYTIPAMSAGQAKTYVVPRQARYFHVVYTNGGTNQTTFRLQTILNRTGTAPSSQRAGDAYTNETDLVQQQSFLMGYNGTTWDRLRTTGTGVLTTSTVLTTGAATIGAISNTTFAATQSGNWTSRIVGNAGATLDSTVGAGTAPTNQQVV